MPGKGKEKNFMGKAFLFKKSTASGTVVFVQGDGLDCRVPVKVTHCPKPVMREVMEKVIENGKPKLDAEGNVVLMPKLGADGKPAFEQVLDENKKPLFRDPKYAERTAILETFAARVDSDVYCKPVTVSKRVSDEGCVNYIITCDKEVIPVDVIDFSSESKPDYSYNRHCTQMRLIAG